MFHKHQIFKLIVLSLALLPVTSYAQTLEHYTASSHTADAITGDVSIASNKLVLMKKAYPLSLVRNLDASQLNDAGKIASVMQPAAAQLYKTKIPASVHLKRGNTVCGKSDANWMLKVDSVDAIDHSQNLTLMFFAGEREPNLDYATLSKTTGILCGGYGYSK